VSALAFAWLALLGFGASALHMTLVAHAVCPSHGDVVHADEHQHTTAGNSQGDAELGQELDQQPAADDDHGHCDALMVSPSLTEPGPALGQADTLAYRLEASPHLRDVRRSRRRLLLDAPKTPPPAG
jgi:hypothetical protein